MVSVSALRDSLEKRVPMTFLTAGVLLPVSLAITVLEIAPGVGGILAIIGLIAAFGGLYGLYPGLKHSSPQLALGGILSITTALIALLLTPLVDAVIGSSIAPLFWMSALILAALSFLLYGSAILRTPNFPRLSGYLMFVPVVVWPAYFAIEQITGEIGPLPIIGFAVISVAFLGIGIVLQMNGTQIDRKEPTPDTTTR